MTRDRKSRHRSQAHPGDEPPTADVQVIFHTTESHHTRCHGEVQSHPGAVSVHQGVHPCPCWMAHLMKGKGLQDPIDKKTINCDATFRDIFGTDKIQYTQIPHLIQPHLAPADPIEITYSIK